MTTVSIFRDSEEPARGVDHGLHEQQVFGELREQPGLLQAVRGSVARLVEQGEHAQGDASNAACCNQLKEKKTDYAWK